MEKREANRYRVDLVSGGYIEIYLEIEDILGMGAEDLDFVFGIVDQLKTYSDDAAALIGPAREQP